MIDRIEHDGAYFSVTLEPDQDHGAPWEEEDGHGPVSDWRRPNYAGYAPKAPGERPLCTDRQSARFYDFAEACKIARRDGWGSEGDEGMKPRQKAAHAAEADFERLRQWCNDQWSYVGVVVEMLDDEGEPMGETESLWGIESDAGDYLEEVAHELAGEILARLHAAAA